MASFWSWLAGVLAFIFKVEAAPVASEAVKEGAAQEAAAQAIQGEKAAQAEAQAAQDAPKDRTGTVKALDNGTF